MGAQGCELLKHFALMGVAEAERGKVTIVDNKAVKMYHLMRHSLFDAQDIRVISHLVCISTAG